MLDTSVGGYEGDTPLLVRSIQEGLRRYAVRKWLVRSTQKFCYIVFRLQFLLQKGPILIKKHNTRDVQSQITLKIKVVCLKQKDHNIIYKQGTTQTLGFLFLQMYGMYCV